MNIKRTYLKRTDLDSKTKHLLNTLASFCGKHQNRISWYTQDVIADYMSTSKRTVQRALKLALEKGLLQVKRRWRRCHIYTLNCLVTPSNSDKLAQEEKPIYKENGFQNAVSFLPPKNLNPIIADIESTVGTSKDRFCWMAVVKKCSETSIRAALSSLRIAMREKVVYKPAAYLVRTLKNEHPGLFSKSQHIIQKPVPPAPPPPQLTPPDMEMNLERVRALLSTMRC